MYKDATAQQAAIAAYNAYLALGSDVKDALDELFVTDDNGNQCRFSARLAALRQIADNGTGSSGSSSADNEFDKVNTALRDAGYTAPKLGVDFTVSFPVELERGEDYDYTYSDDGVLTVTVKRGDKEHWLDAAEHSKNSHTLNCSMTFVNKGYTQFSDINGNGGNESGAWTAYIDGTMTLKTIEDGMEIGPSNSFAAVNYVDSVLSVTPSTGFSDMRSLMVWKDSDGKLTKYLLVYRVEIEDSFYYEREDAIIVTPAETSRTTTDLNANWEATQAENGVVTVMPTTGNTIKGLMGSKYDTNDYQTLGTVTVKAPAGYQLDLDECIVVQGCGDIFSNDRTTNTNGAAVCNIAIVPVENKADTSEVRVTWINPTTTDVKQESLKIIVTDRSIFGGLADGTGLAVTTPDTVNQNPMSGAQVAYDDNGVFYTTFSGTTSQLPDLDDLQKGVLLTPPADIANQVTYFRARSLSRNFPTFDESDISDIIRDFDNSTAYGINDSTKDQARTVPYVATEVQEIGGVTVCFTFTQDYNFKIVQWLKQESNGSYTVLGYSYVSGRNDAFISKTVTQSVSTPAENDAPFILGTDMEFYCNRYPQKDGDENVQYFRFRVHGEGLPEGGKYKVYIPYDYFGMTKDEGLRRAARGEKPTIYHYYGNHELRDGAEGEFKGEYTEYGVYFEVTSFSPFVVDCSASSTGSHPYRVSGAAKAESPTTFDAGIALYGALAVSSLAGMGGVCSVKRMSKKNRKF